MKHMSRTACLSVCVLLLWAVCLNLTGCALFADPNKKIMVDIKAQYQGLENQRVAVMVSADGYTLYEHPDAPMLLCRAVTGRIATNVPGITVTVPDSVIRFQKTNPYWTNLRYGELARRLGVDKIVLIDLVEYRTHEPGNAHIWQGVITANIGVVDASIPDPDNFVFYNTVTAKFPQNSSIGVINSDHESIQLGMVVLFARASGGLFYDHQVEAED